MTKEPKKPKKHVTTPVSEAVSAMADVKGAPAPASISTTAHVKSTTVPMSTDGLSTSTSQPDSVLAENLDTEFVAKAEQLIARIRSQSELGFLRLFLKYFRELVNEYTYHNSEEDLTKKVFPPDQQRKINIASNELRKALALVFAENPAMLHAFDYARDQVFQQNNIAYVRGVKLNDEKLIATSAMRVHFSWKKTDDFAICKDGVHRHHIYINDNATSPIKEIRLVGTNSNTVLNVVINADFYQNYLQAVANCEFNLRGDFIESIRYHALHLIDTDYLIQILNFLAAFDESVSVIKDEIISSVSPYIITKARFIHWMQEGDFRCHLPNRTDTTLHRSVEYVCCKENPVFKKVLLLGYKDYCIIGVDINNTNYKDLFPKLKIGFPSCATRFSTTGFGFIIPSTQVLSDFLARLATFDPDVSEIHDHVICSYDPSIFKNQKTAFLMGLHPRLGHKSAISTSLANNSLFDKNVIGNIFSFLDPFQKQVKNKAPAHKGIVSRITSLPIAAPGDAIADARSTSNNSTHRAGADAKSEFDITQLDADAKGCLVRNNFKGPFSYKLGGYDCARISAQMKADISRESAQSGSEPNQISASTKASESSVTTSARPPSHS